MSIYNEEEEWIKESINSILNQTYNCFEFIIVNDNPKRELNAEILQSFNDERLVLITNEDNIGLTKSLNKGLNLAKGKYIARMDADDIAEPYRFINQLDYMESNPECVVCGSIVEIFGHIDRKFVGLYENDEQNKLQLFLGPCFTHPVTMIRQEILIKNRIEYNEECRFAQDYMLWVDLSSYGTFHNIQIPLLKYRFSTNQISTLRLKDQSKIAAKIRRKYIEKFVSSIGDENNFILPDIVTPDILKKLLCIEYNLKPLEPMQRNSLMKIYFVIMSSLKVKEIAFILYFSLMHKFSLTDILKIIRNVLFRKYYL